MHYFLFVLLSLGAEWQRWSCGGAPPPCVTPLFPRFHVCVCGVMFQSFNSYSLHVCLRAQTQPNIHESDSAAAKDETKIESKLVSLQAAVEFSVWSFVFLKLPLQQLEKTYLQKQVWWTMLYVGNWLGVMLNWICETEKTEFPLSRVGYFFLFIKTCSKIYPPPHLLVMQ